MSRPVPSFSRHLSLSAAQFVFAPMPARWQGSPWSFRNAPLTCALKVRWWMEMLKLTTATVLAR
jgi:hypothetical protein